MCSFTVRQESGFSASEFQYLGRENYPRENELFRAYKQLAETMGDRLTVIRTSDLGADKQASYLDIPEETNPIMGNRGIRLCLDRKRMFKAQLRAIYRASAYGNLAIMYPMVSSEAEMDEIEEIIGEVKEGLKEKEIPFRDIQTSIMIETPAAVMISIRVSMFDDRIEVVSPGGLPAGITAEEYLSGKLSILRNRNLANVFYRLGLVEIFGTGITRIKQLYAESLIKPEFEVSENAIKIVLPIFETNVNLTEDEKVIYKFLSKTMLNQ